MDNIKTMNDLWIIPEGSQFFWNDVYLGYVQSVRSKAGIAIQVHIKNFTPNGNNVNYLKEFTCDDDLYINKVQILEN